MDKFAEFLGQFACQKKCNISDKFAECLGQFACQKSIISANYHPAPYHPALAAPWRQGVFAPIMRDAAASLSSVPGSQPAVRSGRIPADGGGGDG